MERKLNKNQLAVLQHLYRFRFGTTILLAHSLGLKNGTFVNQRLRILVEREYLGRKYDSSYKLLGKPAAYYLLPKAFAVLKKHGNVSADVIKNMYKDRLASDQFVAHCISIYTLSQQFEGIFAGRLDFFTKSELHSYENFPRPLPDGFMTLRTSNGSRARARHHFVSIVEESKPFFVAIQELKKYIDFGDDNDWDGKLPSILFICESPSLEKRLQKQSFRVENDADEDLKFYTTTYDRVLGMESAADAIWQPLERVPGPLLQLDKIM